MGPFKLSVLFEFDSWHVWWLQEASVDALLPALLPSSSSSSCLSASRVFDSITLSLRLMAPVFFSKKTSSNINKPRNPVFNFRFLGHLYTILFYFSKVISPKKANLWARFARNAVFHTAVTLTGLASLHVICQKFRVNQSRSIDK